MKDEGQTYQGRVAIKHWKTQASARYQYTSEPFACEQKDGKFVVTSKLTGNFPGSPVKLRFVFGLEGDRIASLEIIPRVMRAARKENANVCHICNARRS